MKWYACWLIIAPSVPAGKSTLLKLMTGDLTPSKGTVTRHPHLSIGRYHQHSVDQLDADKTVLEFFKSTYPNGRELAAGQRELGSAAGTVVTTDSISHS